MRFKRSTLLLIASLSSIIWLQAQSIQKTFNWSDQPLVINDQGQRLEQWHFPQANFSHQAPTLPIWVHRMEAAPGEYEIEVIQSDWEAFPRTPAIDLNAVGRELDFKVQSGRDADGFYVKVSAVPLINSSNGLQRLTSLNIRLKAVRSANVNARGPVNTTVSALSDGNVFKLAVAEDGVYRLSYDFLKNDLGITDLDNIDPRSIKIYGNGGGKLPYYIHAERADDLTENAIFVSGESDGSFDSGDFILFYGQGPNPWQYTAEEDRFDRPMNVYDNRNYYFVKVGGNNGIRITERASLSSTAATSNTYDYLDRWEIDKVNILHEIDEGTGSAQRWYNDFFKIARDKEYDNIFQVPDFVAGEAAEIRAVMSLRASVDSRFTLEANGTSVQSANALRVQGIGTANEVSAPHLTYDVSAVANPMLTGPDVGLRINYPYPAGATESEGWLDYFQIRARRQLIKSQDQMAFRDSRSMQNPSTTFQLSTTNATEVWDVTNPLEPIRQGMQTGSQFGVATSGLLREFIAFSTNGVFLEAEAIGAVAPQNLHGIQVTDMLIVYHPDFTDAAERLAQHRRDHTGLVVEAVTVDQIYNEFSSGSQDPTAIRDFGRMLFERAPDRFRYILLVGDGSFDTRNIYEFGNEFVPVFEHDVHSELQGYPSDDYYAIYEGQENLDELYFDLTVSIGRLTVSTPTQANRVVNKIITYDTDPEALADWRTRMVFVGDDEDGATHSDDANQASKVVEQADKSFNMAKLYFDLYPQESTPGGDRFPSVTEELNRNIFRGTALITYMGHGGPKGWAQERVLSIPDIRSWRNAERQPVFITATCTFAGFDDPTFTSAGEEILLASQGGASALLTTTRPVYAQQNSVLTDATLTQVMRRENDGSRPRLGDIIRRAKNANSTGSSFHNERKFMLIGDPAMRIALPRYRVETSSVNGVAISPGQLDTVRALQRVTISGFVAGDDGSILSNFNGIVYPTIYDKAVRRETLQQDPLSSSRTYTIQKNVIFKGRASVVNGAFSFTFVAPRDIDLSFGQGKISYYASDREQFIDAAGYYEGLVIGGTDPNALSDDQGPEVEVFMNTEDFIFGGTTDANPTLLVKLSDDNGINVVGNSIGHDLEGVLDDDSRNTLLLNEFYEAAVDDHTKGEVRFPLEDLTPGLHRINVKAWDVANNAAEGYTEFVVADDGRVALTQVLNYPNPFTDRTCFQFDHNLAGQDLEVLIQIFTISGTTVKTLRQMVNNDGALRQGDCIEWDGKDEFGDDLARGVYLYRVKVRVPGLEQELKAESEIEKLVILK